MRTISSALGSGLTKQVELADVLDEPWSEFLNIDIKVQTSKIFTAGGIGSFKWHCPDGISSKSVSLLNHEFNLYRGLFPLKVYIGGPPAAGKTHFA